jgi:hypothetical protein
MTVQRLSEWLTLPRPFRPRPINKRDAHRRINKIARALLPGAVDEATGHAADNLVNAWAVGWASAVNQQYFEYATLADLRVERAAARRVRPQLRHEQDQRYLDELATGRAAALAGLIGQPTAPTVAPPAAPPVVRHDGPVTGYADASLVAGQPAGRYVHALAFTLAAGADAAALWQVLQLLMGSSPGWLSALVVAGLTAAALYLAHMTGALLRDRVAAVRWVRPAKAWLCMATWLVLGLICFWVRLLVLPEEMVTDGSFGSAQESTVVTAARDATMENAIVFLGLYVGAGVVTAIGAYVTRNPLAAAYRAACQAHRRAARRARASAAAFHKADARWRAQVAARANAARILQYRVHDCWTFATELKQHARLVIAQGAQDPAFTDAVLDQDWITHPLWPVAGALPPTGNGPPADERGNGRKRHG